MKNFVLGVLALVALSACGTTDGDGPADTLDTMGMLGVPSPTLIGQNVMLVDATLNGHAGGRLLVDTGSPLTFVNAAWFSGAQLPAATQVTVDIGIGALTIDDVPSIQTTGGAMDQLRLAGILGGNVLRQFSTTFNYRDRQFWMGAGPSPDDVLPATSIAFKLSGGGIGKLDGSFIRFLATRVPISVEVEGKSHMLVLDTGASDVTLRTGVFDELVADGRAVLDDMLVSTVAGVTTARVARCRSISVSGETLTNIAVMAFADTILDTISDELGYTVDGLLGGDFLREFLVTIDYRKGRVDLGRYGSRAHIHDEFERVGMWLSTSGASSFVVASVRRGSAVEKAGIAKGDEVVSIDGQTLAGLDLFAVDSLLNGQAGSTHRIGLGQARDARIANAELDVLVEALVPAPN